MHADQMIVSTELATVLVREQFPQWAELSVRPVEAIGTTNAVYRIGDELAARFPIRRDDSRKAKARVLRETAAAQQLAKCSPFPAPVPMGIGGPGHGYPLAWSVQTWLQGSPATTPELAWSTPLALDIAALIAALRATPTGGAVFSGEGRGGNLHDHEAWMRECLRENVRFIDVAPLERLWSQFRELPRETPDGMCHGDLIPGNLLVEGERLVGILDTGGFGAADPALDLVAAWHFFEDAPRSALRAALCSDDLEWERGRAWAFEQAMGLVWYYARSNPSLSELGCRTLRRVLAARSA